MSMERSNSSETNRMSLQHLAVFMILWRSSHATHHMYHVMEACRTPFLLQPSGRLVYADLSQRPDHTFDLHILPHTVDCELLE